jgi:hypothetical protein
MNTSDIKNLAILTEALRGRNTHTLYSREVFRTGRQFDDDSIILNIYFDPIEPYEHGVELNWDAGYPFLDDPRIVADRNEMISSGKAYIQLKIGKDPNTGDLFIIGTYSLPKSSRFNKKHYFDSKYTLDDIIDRGVEMGYFIRSKEFIVILYLPEDAQICPCVAWLKSLGVKNVDSIEDIFADPYNTTQ